MKEVKDETWSKTFTISFSKTLGIGFGISLLICGIFWLLTLYFKSTHPDSIELITLFSGCLVGVSLIIASKAIANNRKLHDERMKFETDLFLNKLISNWYNDLSSHVARARKILRENSAKFDTKEGSRTLLDYFHDNPMEMESFYAVLNYLEHIAIMVDTNMLNEESVKVSFGGVYRVYYTKTKLFLDVSREHGGVHQKKTFCNFEQLAEKWVN